MITIKNRWQEKKICMRWWRKIMQQCKNNKKTVIKQLTWNKIFCKIREKSFKWKRCANNKNGGVNNEKVVEKQKAQAG